MNRRTQARTLLLLSVMLLPGCLVVTCGSAPAAPATGQRATERGEAPPAPAERRSDW
jgi:hypothetical protein